MQPNRPASASLHPANATRGRIRPESAGRVRPQSAGINPEPPPPGMGMDVSERVEYVSGGGSQQPFQPSGSGSFAGTGDLVRNVRGRPTSARSNLSELSERGVNSENTKAFKGLHEARSEGAWLEAKFQRSGHAAPAEGEMTIVIEYCYNSRETQISTWHSEQRYHEEAELVRQYVLHYCPEARIFIVPSDFRTATSFHRGGEARLGAFEIDARIRVDGELVSVNLWSKLNTRLWPVWPDWQDNLRQLLPVFELLIRPCAEYDDGSIKYIEGVSATLLNYDGSKQVAHGPVGASGLHVRLMRGTYTIKIPETTNYFAESAKLELARVPAPSSEGAVELKVPLFAKPKLTAKVALGIDASGVLRYTDATLDDVVITAKDQKTGELLYQGPPPRPGEPLNIDLMTYKGRIGLPKDGLAASLKPRPALGGPSRTSLPPQAWAGAEGEEADAVAAAAAAEASALGDGWLINVEASLPRHPNAPLDPALASHTVRLLKGGAPEVPLQLARETRPVLVSVSTPEAFTDRWCRGLRIPPVPITVRHVKDPNNVVCVGEAVVSPLRSPDDPVAAVLRLPQPLVLNETYAILAAATAMTRQAAETLTVRGGDGELKLVLMPERAVAGVSLRWSVASVGQGHWADRLPLPEGFVYNIYHRETEALVLTGTFNPTLGQGSGGGANSKEGVTELNGEGALFVGEAYLLEVLAEAGVQATQQVFTLDGEAGARVTIDVPLRRAVTTVQLKARSDLANSGHWAAPLLLPPSIAFTIVHAGMDVPVGDPTYYTDGQGNALLAGQDALFVNQRYKVRVAGSATVQAGEYEFVATEGVTNVELTLRRQTVDVRVQLRSAYGGTEHWASSLSLPTGVTLRVKHKKLGAMVLSCAADGQGGATLGGPAGLFVGETYTLEAPAAAQLKAASVDFTIAAAAAQTQTQTQVVPLVVERATADVTLAMRIQQPSGSAHAYAALLAAPAGVRYAVTHKRLQREVASGYTDQVAKAVLRRKGTLFVGEEYEVSAEGGNGIQAATRGFVVAAHHTEVALAVARSRAHLEFEMVSALAGSAHWGASLPLPNDIGYEVRHTGSGSLIFSGVANPAPPIDSQVLASFNRHDRDASGELDRREVLLALHDLGVRASEAHVSEAIRQFDASADGMLQKSEFNQLYAALRAFNEAGGGEVGAFAVGGGAHTSVRGTVDGEKAGLYVGEGYTLVVPSTELFDESSVDFVVAEAGRQTASILQLRRAAADVDVALRSSHAGTPHWSAPLPLPGGVPFRIVHSRLGLVVTGGTTDGESRAALPAASGALLVSELYTIQVDTTDAYRMDSADGATFRVSGRKSTVSLPMARQTGVVELACRSAKSGTAHWSAPLPIPDGISFNVYHKQLACVVANGATAARGGCVIDAAEALFVGEAYVLEVPASAHVRATSREFVVSAAPQQLPVLIERASGQVMVHIASSEASLATLPGLQISLRHKELGLLVAPPLALGGDRAELLGDDALLVGQTYVLEVSDHPAINPCATEFTVQSHPVRVELMLERAAAAVTLVFRAASGDGRPAPIGFENEPPTAQRPGSAAAARTPGTPSRRKGGSGSTKSLGKFGSTADLAASRGGHDAGITPHWAAGLSLPAGIRFEVRHKQTDQLVASGQTRTAEEAPKVALQSGRLFAEEAYVLHVLPGDFVDASSCEFLARGDGESQEVTLMVKRVAGAVSASFVSYEFGSNHWASSLQLPPDVRFEVRHKATSALAFSGGGGPTNKVALPSAGVLFVGETFVLQALSSRLLRGAACEFTARSVPQQIELALERGIGDVSLSLRAADARPLPPGIPFQVWHQQLQCVVCEGRTTLAASEVPCDPWFVNQGALYVGESYVLAVPAGHGWKTTAVSFTVGDVGLVQLELAREEGRATLHLTNAKSGTGHWSEQLALPRELLVLVRRAGEDEKAGRALVPEVAEKAVRASVDVAAGGTVLLAHERYVLELQPSDAVLRAAAELKLGSSSSPGSVELRVPRAWKPAVVVLLSTADGIALPSGLHVRAVHAALQVSVAAETTRVSDIEVRCTLQTPEAFFVGEEYEIRVDAGHGVAEAFQLFTVATSIVGKSADVVLNLGRATGELSVRLFPARLGTDHWAANLPLPPQQLEVLQTGQLVASTTVTWLANQPNVVSKLSALASLFVGQQYTVRVIESESVLPVTLPVAVEHYAQELPLPLSRVWKRARVTLRSRQELPIPFGVRVQVRHKGLGCIVASATTGEEEAQEYERQLESAQAAQRAAASTAQADQAVGKIATFMQGREVYFAGAGDDDGAAPAQLSWSVDHPKPAYAAQNAATLDGIAAILTEFDTIVLEVRGETGHADHAPEKVAKYYGMHATKDVQAIMDRLAKQRATACVAALVERGVPQERLYVTYQGRAGGVRTDFIPRSMKDSAARAAGAAARLEALKAELGGVRFHAANELGMPSATQFWSVDHLDAGARAANYAVLRAVVAIMLDHPELRLEVNAATNARAEMPPATPGDAIRAPDALCSRFNLHALEAELVVDRLAQMRVESLMRSLIELGLPEPQVLGTFDGSADEARTTFGARTTSWRDAQQEAARRAEEVPRSGTEAAAHDLRPGQERLRALLAPGSLAWNTPAEAAKAIEQSWEVAHRSPDASAANASLLDGLAALLFEFPHAMLVVHVETPKSSAAPPVLASHFGLSAKKEAVAIYDELARRRGAAVVGALAQRGVPAARVSHTARGAGGAVHAEFDLVPLPAGPPALQRRATSMLLEGQKLARITRSTSVMLGRGARGSQYVNVNKPTSTSAWISTPDALFVGEKYVLESVPQPAIGVPRCTLDFQMPAHDEELELFLERPTGDINLQLVYRKANTPHWSAPLQLPRSATIRVRHATVGVVLPETPLEAGAEGGALTLGNASHLSLAVLRYSLRSQLFVGETYTLEVLESAELHAATVEFTVDEPKGPQTVQVLVDRKWRDVTVRLRHARGAAGEVHELPAGISVRARHDVVGVETTSGVTPAGGVQATCHLNGAEALYVGQPYTLLVEAGSGLTVISDGSLVVKSGTTDDVVDLIVDRACGEVEIRLHNALDGSGHWAEALPLPEKVSMVIRDKLSLSTVKVRTASAEIRDATQQAQQAQQRTVAAQTFNLTTGVAPWVLAATHGRFKAGRAPTCGGHALWYKAQAPARWLGSDKNDWPPGDTTFELSFEVSDPSAAHFELPYCVDNSVKLATLNGRPIDHGTSQAFQKFGGASTIRASGASVFVLGSNVLRVTIANGGTSPNPMGFYAKGVATVASPTTVAAGPVKIMGAVIKRESQLYVQRTYVVELEDTELLLPASLEFTVQDGRSVVVLPVQRAVGPANALLRTLGAGTSHWAATLPLPEAFSFRVVHKQLGAVVHEAEVRQPTNARTNSESVELPMPRNLFVGETYTLEAGYQGAAAAAAAQAEVKRFMVGKRVEFNGAGDRNLPNIEQSWSISILNEPSKLQMNMDILDGIVQIMGQFQLVRFRIHGETGTADRAPERLARFYGLHETNDVQAIMDHLAENRAKACMDALIQRGIDPSRLYVTFKARTGNIITDFVPEVTPDPISGLVHCRTDWVVRKLRTSPELRLERASTDVRVQFRGLHPEPSHWSNHLKMPSGLRVALRHVGLDVEVAAGVVADGQCFLSGSGHIIAREEYHLSVERGAYTDAAEELVVPPPGAMAAILRVGWQARLVRFALVAVDKQVSKAAQAAEALARVRAFMEENDVFFNGAGEPNLPTVAQAWAIDHLDAPKREANYNTIRGLASILKEYPELHCEVHGETGAADTAPRPLAEYLGLHYLRDVQPIMDKLAEQRAQACMQALAQAGVPASQLFVTYKGRGGNIRVDFIPRDASHSTGYGSGADVDEGDLRVELPAGIPFHVRHVASDQVIVTGRTEERGLEVLCPLPPSAALFVAHDYALEALAGPGTEPNKATFHMAADLTEDDTLEVKLPIKRCAIGDVVLKMESAAPPAAREWSRVLLLPSNVGYHVFDRAGGVASTGLVPDPLAGAPINTFELRFGETYRVGVPETAMLLAADAGEITLEGKRKELLVQVGRKTNDVALLVRTDKADTDHWAARLPLPELFDVVVKHKALDAVVQTLTVEGCTSSRYRTPLNREQLIVGETYSVRIGCSGRAQAELAMKQVAKFMEGKTVHFNGAGDSKLPTIEQSWNVDFMSFGDETGEAKRAMNLAVLDGVADILRRFPAVRMQIHGETGNSDVAPTELARYFKLRPKEDVQRICDGLAENRASACMQALVARGIEPSRLYITYKSRTGNLKTDFIAHPAELTGAEADALMGVIVAVGEFTVQPQNATPPQELELVLARTTGSLVVRLRNPQYNSGHWSGCLALANGVPLFVRHVGLGIESDLLTAEVYDNEALLSGADTLFVGERYLVYAPDTIRSTAASAEVVVVAGTSVLELAMLRPARRIHLEVQTMRPSAELLSRVERARKAVEAYVEDHDVFFNGAAERATKESKLGIPQAWNIEHLDAEYTRNNMETIEGIASILNHPDYKDISCEVFGQTGEAEAAPAALAEYHKLDRRADVQEIMDRLARSRADACREALVRKGVQASRLYTKFAGRNGHLKVDFIPRVHREDNDLVLPAGIPFRVLHHRTSQEDAALLREALKRIKDFMELNDIFFNGAGEPSLPSTEQAWAIDHLDTSVRAANWKTIEGIAQIMNYYPHLCLEVHGETGAAKQAPQRLAEYFRLADRVTDVQEAMDRLAEYRAQACLGALIHKGVDGHRLFVTYKGRGGNIRVDFIPRSVNPYAAPPGGDCCKEPLALVHEGHTATHGQDVVCPLPEGAALYVDEEYVLQVPHRPEVLSLDAGGSVAVADVCLESAYIPFAVSSESDVSSVVRASLPLRRIQGAGLNLLARYVMHNTVDWSAQLPLPRGIHFAVHPKGADPRAMPVQKGQLEQSGAAQSSAQLPPTGLVPGREMEVRVRQSAAIVEAAQLFVPTSEAQEVIIMLDRVKVDVMVRWGWAVGAWYEHLPLPSAVPYTLLHHELQIEAGMGVLRRSSMAAPSEADVLRNATARVKDFIDKNDVFFNGASQKDLPQIGQSWSINHMDGGKRDKNWATIQGIAQIMNDFPTLGLEIHGQSASKAGQSAPQPLADRYGLRPSEDHRELMEHLARNRAAACRDALVQRGVASHRMVVTAQALGTEMKTDFVPLLETDLRSKRRVERAAAAKRREAEAAVARKQVMDFMEVNDVFFNGARERKTKESALGIAQAWNINHLDAEKRQKNWTTIEGIAQRLNTFPEIACEVRGETTEAKKAEPLLAQHFGLDAERDVQAIMDKLGEQRAIACRDALIERGVDARRFFVSYQGRAGQMKVDFIPSASKLPGQKDDDDDPPPRPAPPPVATLGEPLDAVKGLLVQEGFELRVGAPSDANWAPVSAAQIVPCVFDVPAQPTEVRLELAPASGNVAVTIVSELQGTDHWAAALPLPEQVRYEVLHRRINTRVIGAGGEALAPPRTVLPSEGALLAGEEYVLTVKDRAVEPASVTFKVRGATEWTDVALRLRPRECAALSLVFDIAHGLLPRGVRYRISSVRRAPPADAAELERAASALARVKAFMEQNDVFFNGVADKSLPTIAQSWSVGHTDAAKSAQNRRTLDGIAAILAEYPSLGLQVHGQTGASNTAPEELARYYQMRAKEDVAPLYEHLARNRATACRDYFVAAGIDPTRLHVTSEGRASSPKTDFIPRPLAEIVAQAARDLPEAEQGAAAQPDRTILEGVTDRDGTEVPVAITAQQASRFLLGHRYVLEVLDGGAGGVAPHVQVFRLDEARAEVRAHLHLQGDLTFNWSGPRAERPEVEQTGDGDDGSDDDGDTPVVGIIPLTITHRQTGVIKVRDTKLEPPDPTVVRGKGLLLQGEEYVLTTEHTAATPTASGWNPISVPFVLTSGLDTYVIPMTPSTTAPPPPNAQPGARIVVSVGQVAQWARGLPLPSPLGYVVSREADGVVVAQGPLSADGAGALRANTLRVGERYTLALATDAHVDPTRMDEAALRATFAAADLDGSGDVSAAELATFRQRRQAESRNAMCFLSGALRFAAADGSTRQELRLNVGRRTRDVRVTLLGPNGAPPADALQLQASHVAVPHVAACGARTEAGGAKTTLPGIDALFVGEQYVLQVGGGASTAPTTIRFSPAAALEGVVDAVQELPPTTLPALSSGWPDERPPAENAQSVAVANAALLRAALKGLRTDNKAILAALAGKSPAELQMLREAYKAQQAGSDLREDVKKRGSLLKGKASKLEQLIVRDKAELDAIMINFGIKAAAKGTGKLEPISELLEVLCTSMPHSLVALRAMYTSMYAKDPVAAIREAFGAAASTSATDSAVMLLSGLLENAAAAADYSTSDAVPSDAEQLRAGLADASSEGAVRIMALFASRSRSHMRAVAVAAAAAAATGGTPADVTAQLKARFSGALQRALVLLIEPAETHYARKLHAAFFGLKKTPELEGGRTLAAGAKSTSALERQQSKSGFMTHDDTLVTVVASRHGRDLAGIKHAYVQQYQKPLVDVLGSETHGDLKTLLVGLVRETVPFSGEYS